MGEQSPPSTGPSSDQEYHNDNGTPENSEAQTSSSSDQDDTGVTHTSQANTSSIQDDSAANHASPAGTSSGQNDSAANNTSPAPDPRPMRVLQVRRDTHMTVTVEEPSDPRPLISRVYRTHFFPPASPSSSSRQNHPWSSHRHRRAPPVQPGSSSLRIQALIDEVQRHHPLFPQNVSHLSAAAFQAMFHLRQNRIHEILRRRREKGEIVSATQLELDRIRCACGMCWDTVNDRRCVGVEERGMCVPCAEAGYTVQQCGLAENRIRLTYRGS